MTPESRAVVCRARAAECRALVRIYGGPVERRAEMISRAGDHWAAAAVAEAQAAAASPHPLVSARRCSADLLAATAAWMRAARESATDAERRLSNAMSLSARAFRNRSPNTFRLAAQVREARTMHRSKSIRVAQLRGDLRRARRAAAFAAGRSSHTAMAAAHPHPF